MSSKNDKIDKQNLKEYKRAVKDANKEFKRVDKKLKKLEKKENVKRFRNRLNTQGKKLSVFTTYLVVDLKLLQRVVATKDRIIKIESDMTMSNKTIPAKPKEAVETPLSENTVSEVDVKE